MKDFLKKFARAFLFFGSLVFALVTVYVVGIFYGDVAMLVALTFLSALIAAIFMDEEDT